MKILQAIYCLGRGGAERLAIDITNEINKRDDAEALLVSFDKNPNGEYPLDNVNSKFCPVNFKISILGKNYFNIDNYLNTVSDFKPNIIHSHRYITEIITREVLFPDIAYFSHFHDNISQFRNFNSLTLFNKKYLTDFYEKQRLYPKYIKCKNNFITISQNTFNYAKNLFNSKELNFFLLNNAINFKKFNSVYRKKNISESGKINLITIGSLIPIKNHFFLIKAIKILKESGYDICLNILGNGPLYNELSLKIKEDNLQNEIILHGFVDNVEDYLKDAHIYLHSCISEAFGLVMIEAMAAGLPCITLDGGGNRDIIKNGENGYMFFEQNPGLFTEKIISFIKNPDLYNSLSFNSIEFAKKYDISNYVEKLVKLYKKALVDKGIPAQ